MRKILIGALIIILIACAGFILFKGFRIGNFEVSSIMGLSEKNKSLDDSISNLKQMKEVKFAQSNDELQQATSNLKLQKEQYASLIGASSEEDISSAIQTEKYEVEYLWVKLGNHATKNGITLKMDITKGTSLENKKYNLVFTATGSYINVTEFVYQIENDSTLGFKIENFKLLPSGGTTTTTANNNNNNDNTNTTANNTTTTSSDVQNLVATFTVKDVYIDLDQLTESVVENIDEPINNESQNEINQDTNTVVDNNNIVE